MRLFTFVFLLVSYHCEILAQVVPNEEDWTKLPQGVKPGDHTAPPSDAIVLFDGQNLNEWTDLQGDSAKWTIKNGAFQVSPGAGDIYTKRSFGDAQLHVEWMIPSVDHGNGNSGIYLQGKYEVQIFNSYKNETKIYYNGQTGSLYKQHTPLVNASRANGEWNTYDIIFTAPRFEGDKLISPAEFTVFHNGVLIQHNAKLKGITTHQKTTSYSAHPLQQPLMIQDHGDPVLFRNIWIREL